MGAKTQMFVIFPTPLISHYPLPFNFLLYADCAGYRTRPGEALWEVKYCISWQYYAYPSLCAPFCSLFQSLSPPLSPSWKMLSWSYRDNIERVPHLFCCYLFWLLPHHPYARMGRLYLLYREKKDQEKVKEGWHADMLTVVAAGVREEGGSGENLDDDKTNWSLPV